MFKILHQKKYFDILQQKNSVQQDSIHDQIVENSSMSIEIKCKELNSTLVSGFALEASKHESTC